MTPQRPIEVSNASKACADAWIMRDGLIETQPELVQEMDKVCEWLGEYYTNKYFQWQRMGGTSDIQSIALDGLVFPPYNGELLDTSAAIVRSMELDDMEQDWHKQVTELRGGL